MRPKLSLCRVPLTLTLTMPEGNIRSHEALHNWSRLVNAALRPVTMTMLEAIEAPALRRWRGALHANNLDGERVPGAAGAPTEKVPVFSDRSVAIIRHAPKRVNRTGGQPEEAEHDFFEVIVSPAVGAPTIAAGMTSSMAASSTTVPLQPVPETKSRAPMLVPTAPREPRTPPMTRTEDGFIKAEHPKLLWCPVHQGPLIMRQNPADRSLFLACDMYPICKVTMPPWKAPPPGSPPHRGPSVSATAKAPPGFSPRMIAQQQEVNAASDRVQADHQQATAEGV